MRTSVSAQSELIFDREGETVFIDEWLKSLPFQVQTKCLFYLERLQNEGHHFRRPVADILRNGIYELRPSIQGVHYRILYFFAGKNVVVVSHGLTKESQVPAVEINRAIERKKKFEANPRLHTFKRG